jgi:hypothetical protein
VPDVELLDLGNFCDRMEVSRREPVSGMHSQLEFCGESCSFAQCGEWSGVAGMVREVARMEFDRVRAYLPGHAHGGFIRTDEQTRADTGFPQGGNGAFHPRRVLHYIQPALGRHFLAALGNEGYLIRFGGDRDCDHLIGAGELEVEIGTDGGAENSDVGVLNVATIFPEVCGDPVHAYFLADQGGLDRVGFVSASRLPERRDVVDVHIKALVACSHIRPEYNFFPMKKLLLAFVVVGALACHTAAPPSTSTVDNSPGAKTSTAAVQRFFAAVHAQDLQAMSLVWGTSKGAARDNMDRAQLEKREVILQCYFNYNTFRILNESPTSETRRMVRVELQRDGKTRTPVVYTVLGPDGRWYVENLDIAAVKDFCAMAPVSPGNT